MAMKEVDLKLTSNNVTLTVSFDDQIEAVQFGQACASLIVAAAGATGAPEDVQRHAGWLQRTMRRIP